MWKLILSWDLCAKGTPGSIKGALGFTKPPVLCICQLLKILGILCIKIDPNDMKPIRTYHVIETHLIMRFLCQGHPSNFRIMTMLSILETGLP